MSLLGRGQSVTMRIITGSARGTRLETLEGNDTRPTAERVKEAVFSMIQFELDGKRVLDLFAGSGQMGLEALSRGAASAVFVDNNRAAIEIIKRNAQRTHLYDRCVVLNAESTAYLRSSAGREKFDVIILDPPYQDRSIPALLEQIVSSDLAADGSVIICESDDPAEFSVPGFTMRRHAKYGRVYITLLDR